MTAPETGETGVLGSSWRADVPPVLGLLLVALVFFWPILTGQAYLWADFVEQDYPLRQFGLSELVAGRLPVWAPYLFGGVPFLPMIDNGILYPPNWLLLPFIRDGALSFLAMEWHLLGHVALLGVGMYCFCRGVSVSRIGAFTAAVIWMLSGPVVHQVFHTAIVQTVTWLPFVLILLVKALERESVRWAAAAGAVWGMAILGGNPQLFLYTGYTMGLFFLVHVVGTFRSTGNRREALRSAGLFSFVVGSGIAIAAVAFLPAVELAGMSLRSSAGLEGWGVFAPDYRQLITFVLPGFFGQMGPVTWDYWGPGSTDYGYFWETYVYLGMLPALLAGVGVVFARGRVVWFLGLLVAISFLGILGALTPLPSMLELLPAFGTFRAHGRLGLFLGFGVAALAGLGLDVLVRSRADEALGARIRMYAAVSTGFGVLVVAAFTLGRGPLGRWLAGSAEAVPMASASLVVHGGKAVVVLVAGLASLWAWRAMRVRTTVIVGATLAVILGDLFSAGADFSRSPTPPGEYFAETELVRALRSRAQVDGGRVSIETATPRILRMNAGMMFGLETPFDGFASPLQLGATIPPVGAGAAADLLNVTHEVRRGADGRSVGIIDRAGSMPRAWVARDFVVVPELSAVAEAMADPTFDYRSTVTLDRVPGIQVTPTEGTAPELPVVTRERPDRLTVEVDMATPGLLVLSEVYYPAWRARVAGEDREILRADGALRAIPLMEGAHTVELRYQSTALRVGTAVSLLALLLLLRVGLSGRFGRR